MIMAGLVPAMIFFADFPGRGLPPWSRRERCWYRQNQKRPEPRRQVRARYDRARSRTMDLSSSPPEIVARAACSES